MDRLGAGCIVRPDDVETLAFDWGEIRLLSEPKLTGAKQMTCGLVELGIGQGHADHSHPGAEEIIYVISGEGEQTVDGKGPVRVTSGASIFVPEGVTHSTLNTGTDTLRLFVAYSPTGAEEDLRGLPDCKTLPPGQHDTGEFHLVDED
jgi:oxalate decarboxylase/phosphoglucose isomerase-like protein (cupin superfamily)